MVGLITDRGRSLKIESAGEHCESAEGCLLLDLQKPVTPVKSRRERLLSIEPTAASLSEQDERISKSVGELVHREVGEPGGSKLKPERYAVEPPTDFRYGRRRLGVELERRRSKPSAFHEQLDRFQPEQLAKINITVELRQLEWRHAVDKLAWVSERFPARGDHIDLWAVSDHLLNEGTARVKQVFAVIKD